MDKSTRREGRSYPNIKYSSKRVQIPSTQPMMTESRRRLELIMPMTEFNPGTWAATPFIRDWMLDRLVRCAANSARVAYAWLRAQFTSARGRHKRSLSRGQDPCSPECIVGHPVAVVDSPSLCEQRVGHGCAGRALESAVLASLRVSRETSPEAAGFVRKEGANADLISSRTEPSKFALCSASRKLVCESCLDQYGFPHASSHREKRIAPVFSGSRGGTLRGRLDAVRGRGSPTPRAEDAPLRANWRVGRSGPRTVTARVGDSVNKQAKSSPTFGEREQQAGSGAGSSMEQTQTGECTHSVESGRDLVFQLCPPRREVVLDEPRSRVTRRCQRGELAVAGQEGAALRSRLMQISLDRLHRCRRVVSAQASAEDGEV